MPSRSKTNKGKAKGGKRRAQEHDHKIVWNKVKNGAPKKKRTTEWTFSYGGIKINKTG